MKIYEEKLGKKIDEKEVCVYTISNKNNMKVKITNYGGIILSILVPNRVGKECDIVLGYENFDDYKTTGTFFGSIIGRYANRIANGILEINNVKYELAKNNGNNHLHGGNKGFAKVVWDSEIIEDENGECLKLSYFSKDGEENYPGNLNVVAKYRLNDNNELSLEYYGKSDADTVLNLTNHSYFNLGGHDSGDILNHKVKIYGSNITAANEESIPTGEVRNIVGSPMDFTKFKRVGDEIDSNYDQLVFGNGYDHNWIIDNHNGQLKIAAEVIDENSGIALEVYTTKPGVQFYTGNFISEEEIGKGGVKYNKRHGLCLETQYFPDSLNHEGFPDVILKEGQEYRHTTVYKVKVEN